MNFGWGSNSGVLHYWTNDKVKNGRNAGPEYAPESTWDQTTPSDIWKVEDTHLFGSKFYVSGFYSEDDGAFTLHPQGGLNADVLLDDNGVWQGSFWNFDQTALITQYRADANAYFDTGSWSHELKFGAGYREQENDSISILPGSGKAVLTCEGYGCDPGADNIELVEWSRHNIAVTTKYQSAWVQDTLSRDRWTITGGLRWDKQKAHNDPIFDPGQPDVPNGLFPAIDFKGNDAGGLDWESIVPRVGVTYAMGAENKTLMRGTFSRYAAQLGQWVANQVSPHGALQLRLLLLRGRQPQSQARSVGDGLALQLLRLQRQPAEPERFAQHQRPEPRSLHDERGHRRPAAPLLEQGRRQRDADLPQHDRPARPAHADRRRWNDPPRDARRLRAGRHHGRRAAGRQGRHPADLRAQGRALGDRRHPAHQRRPGDRVLGAHPRLPETDVEQLERARQLHLERQQAEGRARVPPLRRPHDNIFAAGGGGDGNDIYVENGYGNKRLSAINSRWSFNVNGVYQVAPEKPWSFNVAGSISGREGSPFIPSTSRSFFGGQVSPRLDDFRLADVYTFDARIEKDFQIKDLRLTASIDGFNLFNSQPVLQRRVVAPSDPADLADSYGVLERLSPRVFRWGVMFHFR